MASFSLKSQRTGVRKEFSLLEIVKLLGDKVNDEIWLEDDEDVFNLSSFIELNNNNSNALQWQREIPNDLIGKSEFTLSQNPINEPVFVYLNGINLKPNFDYTLLNTSIHLNFSLNDQDQLMFIYQTYNQ